MTNGEKYETAQERAEAFRGYCKSKEDCKYCEFYYYDRSMCLNLWLDLEAEEEKSLNCPFCGGRTSYWGPTYDGGDIWVKCDNCGYGGSRHKKLHQAIAAHNRVAKAVNESKARK